MFFSIRFSFNIYFILVYFISICLPFFSCYNNTPSVLKFIGIIVTKIELICRIDSEKWCSEANTPSEKYVNYFWNCYIILSCKTLVKKLAGLWMDIWFFSPFGQIGPKIGDALLIGIHIMCKFHDKSSKQNSLTSERGIFFWFFFCWNRLKNFKNALLTHFWVLLVFFSKSNPKPISS